ncbi:uncharacterized protein LOC126381583 [Pectinophora gossypiella]|uniref:uncharacterized protein LOC126381583 n=1 Tax=Pectinophora gossypiella TaxID=13191 RepID=UPI00214F5899|nr:uncharacterized protein LOC126381583 [Pectinophora gossypiella]
MDPVGDPDPGGSGHPPYVSHTVTISQNDESSVDTGMDTDGSMTVDRSLQETWLKPEYTFKISGYACLREDRSDGHDGVALLDSETQCAEALAKAFIEVADEIFPIKSRPSGYIPSPPWWDSDCTEAIRRRKEAEIIYRELSTDENFNSLSIIMKETRKLFKKKKYESWKDFCLALSPDTRPSLVWQSIRRFRSAFRDTNSGFLPSSLIDPFLDRLAPPFVPQNIILPAISPTTFGIGSLFSLEELKGVLSQVKDSAPGCDGIPYSFLSHLNDKALSYFLELINSILITGNIPSAWKIQTIIPILKPNKDPSEATNYRPIALSSVLMKIAEHLVKIRLEWYIENGKLLGSKPFSW